MKCDNCKTQFNYVFYINSTFWKEARDKAIRAGTEGYLCAHCVLEALGGKEWYIIWNEPAQRIQDSLEETN